MDKMTIDEAIKHTREVAERNRILANSDMLVQKSYDVKLNTLKCNKCADEHEQLAKWLEELKAYKDAEEQGLILRLPCNVGEEIYALTKTFDAMTGKMFYKIKTFKVDKFLYNSLKNFTIVGIEQRSGGFFEKPFSLRDIGKTVFLKKEEAEQALAEMKAGAE